MEVSEDSGSSRVDGKARSNREEWKQRGMETDWESPYRYASGNLHCQAPSQPSFGFGGLIQVVFVFHMQVMPKKNICESREPNHMTTFSPSRQLEENICKHTHHTLKRGGPQQKTDLMDNSNH
jgi:hypothetical protein